MVHNCLLAFHETYHNEYKQKQNSMASQGNSRRLKVAGGWTSHILEHVDNKLHASTFPFIQLLSFSLLVLIVVVVCCIDWAMGYKSVYQ